MTTDQPDVATEDEAADGHKKQDDGGDDDDEGDAEVEGVGQESGW